MMSTEKLFSNSSKIWLKKKRIHKKIVTYIVLTSDNQVSPYNTWPWCTKQLISSFVHITIILNPMKFPSSHHGHSY